MTLGRKPNAALLRRMKLEDVLRNPWVRLQDTPGGMDTRIASQVLNNLRQFSRTSQFFSLCVASVARQLDHRNLRDVHKVFSEMDTNGDGVLELHEVKEGFQKFFGKDSEQVKDVEQVFQRLDLDGSGVIDYTEFCAAGIGERVTLEEDVLFAAFKAFDVQEKRPGRRGFRTLAQISTEKLRFGTNGDNNYDMISVWALACLWIQLAGFHFWADAQAVVCRVKVLSDLEGEIVGRVGSDGTSREGCAWHIYPGLSLRAIEFHLLEPAHFEGSKTNTGWITRQQQMAAALMIQVFEQQY
eukprot:g7091.t1